jgi:hypothetical protein
MTSAAGVALETHVQTSGKLAVAAGDFMETILRMVARAGTVAW